MNFIKKIISVATNRNLPTKPADHSEMYDWLSGLSDQELLSELEIVNDLAKASKRPEGTVDSWLQWEHAAISELMENRGIVTQKTEKESSGRLR